MDLVAQIERDGLGDSSRRALLGWCERYGLLGILLQRVHYVASPLGTVGEDVFLRSASGWVHRRVVPPGGKVPATGRVFIVDLRGRLEAESLIGPSWPRFLQLPKRLRRRGPFSFAQPLMPTFWRYYGEPVEDFINGARSLSKAVRSLHEARLGWVEMHPEQRPRRSKRRTAAAAPWTEREATGVREWGLRELRTLLNGVGPVVRWDDREGQYVHEWAAPSLLSTLALQALEDIAGGQRVITCAVCGKTRVTRSAEAAYCSKRCYWTMHQRRTRQQERQAAGV